MTPLQLDIAVPCPYTEFGMSLKKLVERNLNLQENRIVDFSSDFLSSLNLLMII